jgi:hypothetical protein
MNKVFCGFAAAALLTVGVAGGVGAEAIIVDDGDGKDAWVVSPPAGGTYWTVTVDGAPSSFLVDQGGNLIVDFGASGLDGAVVFEVLGERVHAAR